MQTNKIDGRLTTKPELQQANGTYLTNFVIASDSHMKGADGKTRTDFFRCELWGNRAKAFVENHEKGSQTYVVGTVKTSQYVDDQNKRQQRTVLTVTDFSFVETKAQTQKLAEKAANTAK